MKVYDSKNFLPLQFSIRNINIKALQLAATCDPSLVDEKTEEGRAMIKYATDIIYGKIYHYYKNKDTEQYKRYENLSPLEVYRKLGYYEVLYAIVKNLNEKDSVHLTMKMLDLTGKNCVQKEKDPNQTPCPSSKRSRRYIKDYAMIIIIITPRNYNQ